MTLSPSNLNDASMAWALASPQASRAKSAAAAETPGSFPSSHSLTRLDRMPKITGLLRQSNISRNGTQTASAPRVDLQARMRAVWR